MPARNTTFRCLCSHCCEVDEEGVAHNKSGRLIPMANKAAHLQCVQLRLSASSEQCQQAVETLVRKEMEQITSHNAIDSLGTHMFALTLTDEGPDLSSQASKLWTSHEDFQHNVNSPPPTKVIAPSLSNLAESFTCLAINSIPSYPIPPTDDTDGLPATPFFHQSCKSSMLSAPPCTTSKQERN